MSPSTRFVLACSCAVLIARIAPAADPGVYLWDGGDGSSTSFTEGTNWSPDGAPDGSDVLRFSNAANRTVTDINYNGFRIFFESGAGSYTLGGAALTLGNFTADNTNGVFYSAGANAPKIENNSSNLQTLNVPLTLNSATTFSEINPVSGDLLFSSTVAVTNGQQLRISGSNGKTATFNGVISGTGSTVAINQNSNVVYGAANTYTGDTFINAGSLSFAAGSSLSGGTLQLGDTNATGAAAALRISDLDGGTTISRPIVVRAGSTGVKTIGATNTSGTNTFSGAVTLNDNVNVDVANGGTLAMTGIISGAKTVTKTGDGLLTLGAANTFSGGLVLDGGRTRLTAANTIGGGITINAAGTLEAATAGADSTAFNNLFGAAGNSFVFNGGTFLMSAATTATIDRTLTGRNITVNAGGATFDTQGAYTNFNEGILNQLRFNTTSVLSGSGTLTKNGGGRLQLQNATATGFSGPVVINNGTLEATGGALGNASVTNTITVNGGNWAMSGDASQNVTLSGGAMSTNGGSRTSNGTLSVTSGSYVFLNEFWRDFDTAAPTTVLVRNMTVNGVVSGNGALGVAVNRAGWTSNNGSLILKNPGNTYSGTFTVGKNLKLESNPTGGAGSTLGTAAIQLADGGLVLRDDGSGGGEIGATLNYGNNVSLIAPTDIFNRGVMTGAAFIDVNRATAAGFAENNTIKLGSLTVDNRPLTVQGSNGYGVEFGGASQFAGNATFNTTAALLKFSGGLTEDAAGRTLTKNGNGSLIFTSNAAYTGATTINGGSLVVGGPAGKLSGTPSITLNGASLGIDNSAAIVADRVGNTVPISITNGGISFTSLAGAATTTAETLGAVTVSGTNTIAANQGNPGAISALTIAGLFRENGATVDFVGTNLGQPGNTSRIIIADLIMGIEYLGPWATINGTEFAQYDTTMDSGFVRGVTAVNSITDPVNDSGFTATQHLRLTGTSTTNLTANRSINTVTFANNTDTRTLNVGGNTLTLAGGGIAAGTNAALISGTSAGGLTAGTPELVVTNNAPLEIGVPIRNGAGVLAVAKVGTGTLTLSGMNTFTGDLAVTEGTLSVSDVENSGVPSHIGAGTAVRLSDSASATFQFTGGSDSTNRALNIGALGATIDVTAFGADLTWSGPVTSAGPIAKIGPGNLTLAGNSSITGSTSVIGGGMLVFAGTSTVSGDASVSDASVLKLGGTTTIGGNVAVTGAAGLEVAGAVTIAGDLNVGNNGTTAMVTGASGSLSVGSGSSNAINIGAELAAAGTSSNGMVDLSGVSSFTANVGIIRAGVTVAGGNDGGNNTGTLILAQNNTITATNSILIADSPGNGDGGTRGTIMFGAGTNDVTTPSLTIGGRKYSAFGSIGFGGSLILDNGAGRTALNVGVSNVDTGTAPSSTFDFSGGTLTGNLSSVAVGIRAAGGNGDVNATLNLGNSSSTNVNINVSTGFALRVGAIDYAAGTQPVNQTATGTMVIGGGAVSITSTTAGSSAVVIGHFNGTANITGDTANNAATGTLTIDGGDVTITSAGTNNAINLAPRAVTAGTSALGTNSATATLNINGGSLTVNNRIGGNSTAAQSTSTLNLMGGLLNMQGKDISNINNLMFGGGTLRNLGTLNRALTQTGETSLLDVAANNSVIQGAYDLTDGDVAIAETRSLNASGGTTLNGSASLLVNGSLQGALIVNSGATVRGSGTTQAFTLAGGTIAPGNSPGILGTGNLTLSGGNLTLEINGATAGTGYDQINVAGTVSLTANTNFTLAFGYVPAVGETFTIINNDAADLISFSVGALFTYNGGSALADDTRFTTPQGFEFEINYNGGSGNDVVLTTIVPEPGSATVLLAGIGMLAGLQRFRRRQRV